jgi:hypothetical protein
MIAISPAGFPDVIDQNANTDIIFKSLVDDSEWLRSGYCSRCGDCCDDSENIFSTVDGDGNPGGLTQVVPGKCAYFRWGEDGLAQCLGRDTAYYKNGCVLSPTKIEHITQWPNCTYTFEKINDGN